MGSQGNLPFSLLYYKESKGWSEPVRNCAGVNPCWRRDFRGYESASLCHDLFSISQEVEIALRSRDHCVVLGLKQVLVLFLTWWYRHGVQDSSQYLQS